MHIKRVLLTLVVATRIAMLLPALGVAWIVWQL
jgi:hypothetical protein